MASFCGPTTSRARHVGDPRVLCAHIEGGLGRGLSLGSAGGSDMAFEAGRCKMLVPTATGKRREERANT